MKWIKNGKRKKIRVYPQSHHYCMVSRDLETLSENTCKIKCSNIKILNYKLKMHLQLGGTDTVQQVIF